MGILFRTSGIYLSILKQSCISLGEYSKGDGLKLGTCTFSGATGCGRAAGSSTLLEEQNNRID